MGAGSVMSIWSSVGLDVRAIDTHAVGADEYAGTGPAEVFVDIATTGHHDMIILAVYEGGIDVCLMLTPEAAASLLAKLQQAVGGRSSRVPEFGPSSPCPEAGQHG
jgi:hypothetical protein